MAHIPIVVAIEDTSESMSFGSELTLTLENAARIRVSSLSSEQDARQRSAVVVTPRGDTIEAALPGMGDSEAAVQLMAALLDARYDRADLPEEYADIVNAITNEPSP